MANFDSAESINISSISVETVIGVDTKFKGNIKTDKPIRVDGYFEGTIDCADLVIVTDTGTINGDITCKELQLLGHGEGTVVCEDIFQIASCAEFKGDVTANAFLTQKGCKYEGKLIVKAE